jgi:hypothetical protein
MAVDIRRMNFEELEELNRSGREWRERGKKPAQQSLPEPIRGEPPADAQDSVREITQPVQLNLFGMEQP